MSDNTKAIDTTGGVEAVERALRVLPQLMAPPASLAMAPI